ncbi:MAG: hypothetical protein ACLPKB_12335 [Xanthobacteraceae bacterium]
MKLTAAAPPSAPGDPVPPLLNTEWPPLPPFDPVEEARTAMPLPFGPTVFPLVLALIVTVGPLFPEGPFAGGDVCTPTHVAVLFELPPEPLVDVQVGGETALLMLQEPPVPPVWVPEIEHENIPVPAVPVPGDAPVPVNWMSCVPFVALAALGEPTLSVLIGGAVY